jgi:hypothetical protein
MKRSSHKNKKGEKPVRECRSCGALLPSKYAEKNHVCRP